MGMECLEFRANIIPSYGVLNEFCWTSQEGYSEDLIIKFAEKQLSGICFKDICHSSSIAFAFSYPQKLDSALWKVYELTAGVAPFCIAINGVIPEKHLPDVGQYVCQRCSKLKKLSSVYIWSVLCVGGLSYLMYFYIQ